MPEYKLHREKIEVPKGTGIQGFMHTIEALLKLDRVQGIEIDARGHVTYTRYVREGISADVGPSLAASFDALMPYACVRNGRIEEIVVDEKAPSRAIARLFQRLANEHLYPVAFVTGANTTLWDWIKTREGFELENKEEFYGLPLLPDRHLEDYVLILAASYGRAAHLSESHKSFKIVMPQRQEAAGGGAV